jgi:hypothetical protein
MKSIKFIALISFLCFSAIAQDDVFNLENTLKYARYLNLSKQTELAKSEYSRAFFLSDGADSIATEIFEFYSKNEKHTDILSDYTKYYSHKKSPYRVNKIYFSSFLLKNNTLPNADITFISETDKNDLELTKTLFNSDFKKAKELMAVLPKTNLSNDYELNFNSFSYKQKSPAVAVLLSTAIPGMGKIYSSFWKDGLMSLLFVGSSAYQSYRGFNKTGIKSGIGWAFGSIAFGFYTGNIYGSYKAAHKYNNRQKSNSKKKIENIFKRHI